MRKVFKLQATGNDFLFLESREEEVWGAFSEFVKKICARRWGMGADGLVVYRKKENDYEWSFYNKDGGRVNYCGNAARCFLELVARKEEHKDNFLLKWRGPQEHVFQGGWSLDHGSTLFWPLEEVKKWDLETSEFSLHKMKAFFQERDTSLSTHSLKVGVPHLLFFRPNFWSSYEREEIYQLCQLHFPQFIKSCNLTFFSTETKEYLSWERGVEEETLACGSGALSAFYVYNQLSSVKEQTFYAPGGALLMKRDNSLLSLAAPAQFVYEGVFDESAFGL